MEVEIRNPLLVPVQLTDVQLVCAHSPVVCEQLDSPTKAFDVQPINLVLRPEEKKKVIGALK